MRRIDADRLSARLAARPAIAYDDALPINARLAPGEVAFQLVDAAPRVLLVERRFRDRADLALTEAGEVEAAAAGAVILGLLGSAEPDAVFTSPRIRARRTAALCLGAAGLGAEQTDLVAEFDYGEYEGITSADIMAGRPGWDLWRDGCPGGETPGAVLARASRFVELAADRAPAGIVVAFTHGHMSRALAAAFLGQGAAFAGLLHNDTASVAELRDRDGRMALTGWNLRPHGAAVAS